MEYRHTQIGSVVIALIVGVIILLLVTPFLSFGNIHHIPIPILIIFIGFLVATLTLFYSLTVEIRNKTLICRFGIGIIRKNISLSMIQEVRSVQNPLYSGWGIRWMPGKYWLWNVSGYQAVELVFKDGKHFRIGTDEPDMLVKAIETSKGMGA